MDFTLGRFWRYGADCVVRAEAADARDRTAFANVSDLAHTLRGGGEAALAASPLAEQCPSDLVSGARVLCPWYSAACTAEQSRTLSMAEGAGRFAEAAKLPPRQLMGAERCQTPTCLEYNGTARRRARRSPSFRRRTPMV